MSLERELIQQRTQRIREIEALGFKSYGQRLIPRTTFRRFLADYGSKIVEELDANRVSVKICGRIHTIRRMGKAGFAHLMQNGEKLQIYVKKDAVSGARTTSFGRWSISATSSAPKAICSAPAPAN